MNLKQATIYDSVFNNGTSSTAKLKPTHHLQCKIDMCDLSKKLYYRAFGAEAKLTSSLVCVLDEIPEMKLSYTWDKGIQTVAAGPIDIVMSSQIGSFLQIFAGSDYISMPKTNEFSQHQMKEGSYIGMQLKFRVYADTFNQRYRFMTSTYESWLRFLSMAVMPLMPFTYGNMTKNVVQAGDKVVDTGAEVVAAGVDAAKHAAGTLKAAVGASSNGSDASALLADIEKITASISNLLANSTTFGHLVYNLEIPGYIRPTDSVPWIIKNFSAQPCAEFLRGTWGAKASEDDFRPKPLFIDFTVDVETNQIVTRNQLFSLLAPLNFKQVAQNQGPSNSA